MEKAAKVITLADMMITESIVGLKPGVQMAGDILGTGMDVYDRYARPLIGIKQANVLRQRAENRAIRSLVRQGVGYERGKAA